MKMNQKGSGAIEGLLILVIIGIIGGAGWYVWSNRAKNTNSNEASSNTKDTQTTPANDLITVDKSGSNKGFLVIKDWGIKVKPSTELSNVGYTFGKTSSSISFHTIPIDESTCAGKKQTDIFKSWGIVRYAPDAMFPQPGGTADNDVPIKEGIKPFIENGYAKEINSYYYRLQYPQMGCSEEIPVGFDNKLNDAALEMFKSIEPLN